MPHSTWCRFVQYCFAWWRSRYWIETLQWMRCWVSIGELSDLSYPRLNYYRIQMCAYVLLYNLTECSRLTWGALISPASSSSAHGSTGLSGTSATPPTALGRWDHSHWLGSFSELEGRKVGEIEDGVMDGWRDGWRRMDGWRRDGRRYM